MTIQTTNMSNDGGHDVDELGVQAVERTNDDGFDPDEERAEAWYERCTMERLYHQQ